MVPNRGCLVMISSWMFDSTVLKYIGFESILSRIA